MSEKLQVNVIVVEVPNPPVQVCVRVLSADEARASEEAHRQGLRQSGRRTTVDVPEAERTTRYLPVRRQSPRFTAI
jgi:hypothetical protein